MTRRDAALGEPFELRTEQKGKTVVIVLSGAFGLECVEQLEREFEDVAARSLNRLILDLRGLTFIDSTGMRAIFNMENRSREHQVQLIVARGTGQVRRAFELAGVDRRMTMTDEHPEPGGA
jgi:anti-sigma B factor antagonist